MVGTGLYYFNLIADIISFSKFCLFGKWFYVPVSSYGHVQTVSYNVT